MENKLDKAIPEIARYWAEMNSSSIRRNALVVVPPDVFEWKRGSDWELDVVTTRSKF